MDEDGNKYPDWAKKLRYLTDKWLPRCVSQGHIPDELRKEIDFISNPEELGRVLGKGRTTLYTPSEKVLDSICFFYEIKVTKLANEFKNGFAEHFVVQYRDAHSHRQAEAEELESKCPTSGRKRRTSAARPQPLPARYEERELGLALKALPVKKDVPFDSQLATLDLFPQQAGAGEPWGLDFSLSCQPALVEGLKFAVTCGRLTVECGQASAGSHQERRALLDGRDIAGESGKVIFRVGGDEHTPSYGIEAETGYLGVLLLPEEFVLCKIHGLAPGDTIVARFAAYFQDLEFIGCDAKLSGSFAILRALAEPDFSEAKKRIIARIALRKLPNGDAGWAELCMDGRIFQRTDAGSMNDERD